MYFLVQNTYLKSIVRYLVNVPRNRHILKYKALAVGWFIGAPRRQPETKSEFIPQCCDTFTVLGRRKQHIVANVSISFVSSGDLVPL